MGKKRNFKVRIRGLPWKPTVGSSTRRVPGSLSESKSSPISVLLLLGIPLFPLQVSILWRLSSVCLVRNLDLRLTLGLQHQLWPESYGISQLHRPRTLLSLNSDCKRMNLPGLCGAGYPRLVHSAVAEEFPSPWGKHDSLNPYLLQGLWVPFQRKSHRWNSSSRNIFRTYFCCP